MLKDLVRRLRSRSHPEPAAGRCLAAREQEVPCISSLDDHECDLLKEDRSTRTAMSPPSPAPPQELSSSSDSDDYNEARAAKILARCEREKENNLAASNEEECCVCFSQKATVLAMPCGHRVTCKGCSVRLIQLAHKSNLNEIKCVLCRSTITEYVTERKTKRRERSSAPPQPAPWPTNPIEGIVPYDLNVPRALGRRCYSISTGSALPIKKVQRDQAPSSGSA